MKFCYFFVLFLNISFAIAYGLTPIIPVVYWMTCLGISYLVNIISMIVLGDSIVRIRKLMGTNLQVVQYDDKAMIYHVLSLSLMMITVLFLLIALFVFGAVDYKTDFAENFLILSFFCEFTYFVSMIFLAKIFNTIIDRANKVNESNQDGKLISPRHSVNLNSP